LETFPVIFVQRMRAIIERFQKHVGKKYVKEGVREGLIEKFKSYHDVFLADPLPLLREGRNPGRFSRPKDGEYNF
jgi:hypothetical protein